MWLSKIELTGNKAMSRFCIYSVPIKFAYFQKSFVKSKSEQYSNNGTYIIFRKNDFISISDE